MATPTVDESKLKTYTRGDAEQMECLGGRDVEDAEGGVIAIAKRKWIALTSKLGIPPPVYEKWWTIIRDNYQEKGRHYHTLEHIKLMLDYSDKCLEELKVSVDVMFAIYFHE